MSDDPFELTTRAATLGELHRVRLVAASLRVTATGQTADIGQTGIVVGTGAEADVRITDELVSRKHIELRAEEDGVRVVDRASRNGTFLGSVRLHELVLRESATLQVGGTSIEIVLRDDRVEIGLSPRTTFGEAVAHSKAMRHVFHLLERAAKTDVTVLLEGESGTGKDVLARSLHTESARRDGPFVVVDCGALAPTLLESELFGHEKGAFTGAATGRAGAFEQANGGTVFLDEVGELPIEAQPKLLRVLETKTVRRVGGNRTVHVDVRVVAATNRRLKAAAMRKEFREDLFYRLAVVHVVVPRLRDRKEDIPPLAEMFLRRKVPGDLLGLLLAYDWPGNARELRNVIDRFATFDRADPALLFGDGANAGDRISLDLASLGSLGYHEAKARVVQSFHATVLPRAVEAAGGSVSKAAEQLGIPKASLYRMLQELRSDDEKTDD